MPKSIWRALNLHPGQKLHVMQYGDRVEPMPVWSLAQARGFLAGIDSGVDCEPCRA